MLDFNVVTFVEFLLNDAHDHKIGRLVVPPKLFGKLDAMVQIRSFEKYK